MSRTFSTNSGSVESLKVLERCGGPEQAQIALHRLFESRWPRPRREWSSACRRWGGSAAPSPAGAPRPRHHGRAAGPAAARHTARPDLARGTACASARPPGSRARPRARSRCSRRPRRGQHDARSTRQALRCGPRPHQIAQARSLGLGQLDLLLARPAHAAPPAARRQHASAPHILHVISGTLH